MKSSELRKAGDRSKYVIETKSRFQTIERISKSDSTMMLITNLLSEYEIDNFLHIVMPICRQK